MNDPKVNIEREIKNNNEQMLKNGFVNFEKRKKCKLIKYFSGHFVTSHSNFENKMLQNIILKLGKKTKATPKTS